MLAVTEHRVDGVSGRAYREFQGERYWFWPNRGIYVSQVGRKQRLLHLEVYAAIHGAPPGRWRVGPADGDYSNVDPENWIAFRKPRARKNPVQEVDGVRFYRKPSGYYKAGREYRGGIYMHRYVWECNHGPIPDGMHVHHKDGDKANNNIDNLELLAASVHSKHHGKDNPWVGSEENREQLRAASELAKQWHASKEGRNWHSKNAAQAWEKRKRESVVCQQCGKRFETPWPTRAKFCNQNCKAKALRARRKNDCL